MEQNLTVIQNFNVLPAQSLELLGQRLGLRMSRAELLFCARHYKSRGKGDISIETLRFIDALARPEHTTLDKIAIGEMQTDHAYIADTFADAVSGLKALGKAPEKPFTLEDFAALPARLTAAARSKDITEPIGFGKTAAHYASMGFGVQIPLESAVSRFDVLQPLGLCLKTRADHADALILLCPAPDMQTDAFENTVIGLLQGEHGKHVHCIADLSHESMAHAMLRMTGGALLNLTNLPEQLQDLLALTQYHTGLLLAMPTDASGAMLEQARALGLDAYEPGTIDHAGYLIISHGNDTLLALDVPYLKSICFIRSYSLRADDATLGSLPDTLMLHAPTEALDQSVNEGDEILRTLPPLRTRNATYAAETSYRAAMLCAAKAYCCAVAAGSDPERIWLDVRLWQDSQLAVSQSASELLCALLGLYRFSTTLGVPVHSDTEFAPQAKAIAALASAPSDMVIPPTLQGHGNVYLLMPQSGEDGMPVWSEMRALISYLRREMFEGKIKSARVICGNTPADELMQAANGACGVILNPHSMQILDTPCTCAFLVESDDLPQGTLIAVSTLPEPAQSMAISDQNS